MFQILEDETKHFKVPHFHLSSQWSFLVNQHKITRNKSWNIRDMHRQAMSWTISVLRYLYMYMSSYFYFESINLSIYLLDVIIFDLI